MAFNLTQTLINSHLVSGNMQPGNEIALRIDQALLQDVLGTLVMLELEAMGVDRVGIDRAPNTSTATFSNHDLSQRQIKILMAGGAFNWHDSRRQQ